MHVYWAAHSAHGYQTGRWALADSSDGKKNKTDTKTNKISKVKEEKNDINDFYFLTDPDKFIIKCYPDELHWQLLKKPLSKTEFEELPFTQPAFHELKLKYSGHDSCIVYTSEGKATLEFQICAPAERARHYQFGYKLHTRRDPEAEGEYDVMSLERYCLNYLYEDKAFFEVRFPVTGVFRLEVHCKDPYKQFPSTWVCDYKIICRETSPSCQPLPVVPEIGWGPGEVLRSLGIECLTHRHPVVDLDNEVSTFLRFALPKDKELELDADLVTNNMSREDMKCHVTVEQDGDHVVVQITPPGEGEYALEMYVKEGNCQRDVATYLLQRTKVVEVGVFTMCSCKANTTFFIFEAACIILNNGSDIMFYYVEVGVI